jgi:hypothetical protein
MPAPTGKELWSSRDEESWESVYGAWLARWTECPTVGAKGGPSGGCLMGELMCRRERRSAGEERLQRWLSEVDEFGMM